MSELKLLLGKRIARMRKELNLTQIMFCEKIELSISALAEIETGVTFPRAETLEKIKHALNCTYEDLFNFCDVQNSEQSYKKVCSEINYLYKYDKKSLMILETFIGLLKK